MISLSSSVFVWFFFPFVCFGIFCYFIFLFSFFKLLLFLFNLANPQLCSTALLNNQYNCFLIQIPFLFLSGSWISVDLSHVPFYFL